MAVRPAARVTVIPAHGVKTVSAESLDSRHAGELRATGGAAAQPQEAGAQHVAPVGCGDPAQLVLVPHRLDDPGLEQRPLVQAEVAANPLRMLQQFRALGVLLPWDVPGLFEQRQVAVRLGVACQARIAVPVPGSAEVGAPLDDAQILGRHTVFAQGTPGKHAGDAAADDQRLEVPADRLAGAVAGRPGVGVVAIRQHSLQAGVGARQVEAFVALSAILVAQLFRVASLCHRGHATVAISCRASTSRSGAE